MSYVRVDDLGFPRVLFEIINDYKALQSTLKMTAWFYLPFSHGLGGEYPCKVLLLVLGLFGNSIMVAFSVTFNHVEHIV